MAEQVIVNIKLVDDAEEVKSIFIIGKEGLELRTEPGKTYGWQWSRLRELLQTYIAQTWQRSKEELEEMGFFDGREPDD